MKKILITGSQGFLGKKLVYKLKEKKHIVYLYDIKLNPKHNLEENSTLSKLIDKVDVVYHLAAINTPRDDRIVKVNVLGTLNVLKLVDKSPKKQKLIFPSSFAVYKTPRRNQLVSESHPTVPRNEYGLTKLMGEEIVKYYIHNKSIEGLILRMANIYGHGDVVNRSSIAGFIDNIKKGNKITIYGSGRQTRDFVYVDDVVDALVAALTYKPSIKNHTINICSGKSTSINKSVQIIGEILGKKVKITYKNENYSGGGYWKGDNRVAKKLLNWQPKVSFREGIVRIVNL